MIFESDAWYIAFNIILAVTNGYLGNLSAMFGPKVVDPEDQEITAAIMVATLVLGCGLGSIINVPLVQIL